MSVEAGEYVAAWARSGTRSESYKGVLYVLYTVPGVRAWTCEHRHYSKTDALDCAIGEARARFTCPKCARSARWTDGRSRWTGDEVNEFWCQTCGEETPLDDGEAARLHG